MWRLLPSQPAEVIHLKHEFRAVLRPQVLLVLALSTLSSVALFCVFTYVAPILETVTRVSPRAVTYVLVVFGVGITVGNLVGGRLSDWRQMPTILGGQTLLIVIFVLMPLTMPYAVGVSAMIFVWGLVHFGAGAPLQSRIVDQAKGAPNLASTLNQGAFNLGNAMGASLGGLVLMAGYPYQRLPLASAGVCGVALIVGIVAARTERNSLRRSARDAAVRPAGM